MKKLIEIPGRWALAKLDLLSSYSLRVGGPLKESGWFRSFREGRSVDQTGAPIPWFSYPAIEFLCRRVRPEMRVFEYGCGASTSWWAGKVASVVACEHDEAWYRQVAARVPRQAELHYVPLVYGGEYCQMIQKYHEEFDVVVIDGRDRVNCAQNSIGALNTGGVIIWDNSDRREYEPGLTFLRAKGFKQLEFIGLGPIVAIQSETSILYRAENCFGI